MHTCDVVKRQNNKIQLGTLRNQNMIPVIIPEGYR